MRRSLAERKLLEVTYIWIQKALIYSYIQKASKECSSSLKRSMKVQQKRCKNEIFDATWAYLNVMLIDTLFIHFHISLELWRAILCLCFLNLGAFMFILMAFLHQALNNFRILWQAMGNHPKHPSNCIVSWQKPLRKCNFRNRVLHHLQKLIFIVSL